MQEERTAAVRHFLETVEPVAIIGRSVTEVGEAQHSEGFGKRVWATILKELVQQGGTKFCFQSAGHSKVDVFALSPAAVENAELRTKLEASEAQVTRLRAGGRDLMQQHQLLLRAHAQQQEQQRHHHHHHHHQHQQLESLRMELERRQLLMSESMGQLAELEEDFDTASAALMERTQQLQLCQEQKRAAELEAEATKATLLEVRKGRAEGVAREDHLNATLKDKAKEECDELRKLRTERDERAEQQRKDLQAARDEAKARERELTELKAAAASSAAPNTAATEPTEPEAAQAVKAAAERKRKKKEKKEKKTKENEDKENPAPPPPPLPPPLPTKVSSAAPLSESSFATPAAASSSEKVLAASEVLFASPKSLSNEEKLARMMARSKARREEKENGTNKAAGV